MENSNNTSKKVTEPKVLMRMNAGGDVRYSVFTPLDEEARGVLWWIVSDHQGSSLFDEGVAFAEGDAIWVLESGNNADYVYSQLCQTGIWVYVPGESLEVSPAALEDSKTDDRDRIQPKE